MGKATARISQNHENFWDFGREWNGKEIIMDKGNGKLVEQAGLSWTKLSTYWARKNLIGYDRILFYCSLDSLLS